MFGVASKGGEKSFILLPARTGVRARGQNKGNWRGGGANIYSSIMWPREQADAPVRPIHHRKVQTQPLLIGSQTLLQQRETGASTHKRSATVLWSWANPVTLKHTEKFDLGVSTQGSNWSELLLFFLKQYPIPRAAQTTCC